MVAVLSPKALPELRMTVNEFLRADLPEGWFYELVDGVIEFMRPPDRAHDDAIDPLTRALFAYRSRRGGAIAHVGQKAAVCIPRKVRVRLPDIALYRQWETEGSGTTGWKHVTPFWVAEVVSKGQGKRDYEDKRIDHWRAGIDEYWIIDRHAGQLTILVRGDKDWIETVLHEGDQARSSCLPGFAIPVARLLSGRESKRKLR